MTTLEPGKEWRFAPLVVDLNRDGHLDLVATARLAKPSLNIWLGDGKGDVGFSAQHLGQVFAPGFFSAVFDQRLETEDTQMD